MPRAKSSDNPGMAVSVRSWPVSRPRIVVGLHDDTAVDEERVGRPRGRSSQGAVNRPSLFGPSGEIRWIPAKPDGYLCSGRWPRGAKPILSRRSRSFRLRPDSFRGLSATRCELFDDIGGADRNQVKPRPKTQALTQRAAREPPLRSSIVVFAPGPTSLRADMEEGSG